MTHTYAFETARELADAILDIAEFGVVLWSGEENGWHVVQYRQFL